jgi:hypothetical protein
MNGYEMQGQIEGLVAQIDEQNSTITRLEREKEVLGKALKQLHDECSMYGPDGHRTTLQMGPMLEPSEGAVLQARAALKLVKGEK